MYFRIISSGSKGNCTLIRYKNTVILIDMGITLTLLKENLALEGLEVKDIDGVLFTHDHGDHIRGLKFFSPKICYSLDRTLPSASSNVCYLFETFKIKDLKITPLMTSHDARNPCGYFLKAGNETMTYITDSGRFCMENLDYASNPTYLILESNHDIQMLLRTNRPQLLKDRILSDHGHLCNEDSAFAALELIGDNTKEIVLAHLSEEANTPETAIKAWKNIFQYKSVNFDKYNIRCAHQRIPLVGGSGYED